jgi:hypothetical protein
VAKNNPQAFREALEQNWLDAPPLYQINENARLDRDGVLDPESRIAQQVGKRCRIPVFLKTFGSDIAHTIEENGEQPNVFVTKEMSEEMAQMPDVSGVGSQPSHRGRADSDGPTRGIARPLAAGGGTRRNKG